MNDKISVILQACLGCDKSEITPDKHLFTELYADSLALMDIITTLGETFSFEFTEADIDNISTVESIYQIVAARVDQMN